MNENFDLKTLNKLEKIGYGSFFKVYKVSDTKTNQLYSAKVSKLELEFRTIDILKSYQLICNLNHPTIIKYLGYSPINFHASSCPTIITEYCSNGSLDRICKLERINKSPELWNSTKKLEVIYGIASGMSYLHSHGIIHRDLSNSNILLDELFHPKISGFTLSISEKDEHDQSVVGTYLYIAPEVLKSVEYTSKCDVYSFSFILYEILSGQIPFENYSTFDLLVNVHQNGVRPSFPDFMSSKCIDLIEKCWSEDPDERPTFDEIVNILKTDPKSILNNNFDENEFFNYIKTLQ